jgi:hypothetical protein
MLKQLLFVHKISLLLINMALTQFGKNLLKEMGSRVV